jgi:predicted GNAT family acetyltransferase
MRLHVLTEIAYAGPLASGSLRKVAGAELPLAEQWMREFVRDVGIPPTGSDVGQRVAAGQLFFWVDGDEPRAMASWSRETRSGCAINTVYTPARFRGRGYGTTATAALSEALLAAGRGFCCLYTDLASPTPNSIYAKIGFRPIRDDLEIGFET